MLDFTTALKEIEAKYKISEIKVNEILLWPYLRYVVGNILRVKILNKASTEIKKKKFNSKLKKIYNLKYGILNIFKPCDAIFFSTSKERKFVGNFSISKNINEIYKRYDKPLLVEHAFEDEHFDIKSVSEKNIVSLSLIEILSSMIIKFNLLKYKLTGQDVINSINNRYGINIDLKKISLEFLSRYYLFKLFFKIKKPKILFITVWYGYGPVIKAAKDQGIKTVEIQHGSFNKSHYSYNMEQIIDSSHYPDYILTYSKKYEKFFNNKELILNNIFKPLAVGSFLENIKNNPPLKKDKFKEFKYIVSMSATTNESYLEYDFLRKLSNIFDNVLFIYLPRRNNDFKGAKNLFIAKKLTASDYLPISDLHITGRSSCMYEAAFFEKKTLIYTPFIELQSQIENLKMELNKYPSLYRFIEGDEDFGFILREELKNTFINLDELRSQNLYETDYNKNIKNFIKMISK